MGILRMVVTGTNEKKEPWWQDIGKAANTEVGEVALEKIAKNYAKGNHLQLQEKRDKKNITHCTVEATGNEDKHKDFSKCEIWSKTQSDQINDKEIRGTEFDTTWNLTLTFTNMLDANTALPGVADVTPKNTDLVLGTIDDNQGWHVDKELKGKQKVSVGGTNADQAPGAKKNKLTIVDDDDDDKAEE